MSQVGQIHTAGSLGAVATLTGNVGGAVGPDGGGNIDVVGGAGVTVTGNPGLNSLTITVAGTGGAETFHTDGADATAAANAITIAGGTNINTSGAGSTVTVNLDNSITLSGTATALSFITSTVATNLTLNGVTFTSGGTDANVGQNFTAKAAGNFTFTTATGGEVIYRGLTAGFVASTWHQAQNSVQTADATPTNIVSVVVPDSYMVTIKAYVNGFQSDFTDCVGGEITVTAYRPNLGNVTLVGAPIINVNYTDVGDTSDVDASVDVGTQTVRVQVIGVAAQTWNWVTTYNYMFTQDNS